MDECSQSLSSPSPLDVSMYFRHSVVALDPQSEHSLSVSLVELLYFFRGGVLHRTHLYPAVEYPPPRSSFPVRHLCIAIQILSHTPPPESFGGTVLSVSSSLSNTAVFGT